MSEVAGLESLAPATPPLGEVAPVEPTVAEVATPDAEAQVPQPVKDPDAATKKRLDYLTWRGHDAERKANAAIIDLQKAEARIAQLEQERLEQVRQQTMPRADQFTDAQAFQQAVREHSDQYIAERDKTQQAAAQRQQQVVAQQNLMQHIEARTAEAEAKFPDYREVVNNPALPKLAEVNPILFATVLTHPRMAELTYFLGKNPQEAHRIAYLPPAMANVELGMIAAKLPTATKQASQAPAPPATVGGGTAEVHKDPTKMSYNEFVAWRRRSQAQKR